MTSGQILYLLPYCLSASISFGILLYSWRHRRAKGMSAYSLYIGFQFLSIVAFIFELITPNLEIKLLWDKLQWLSDGMFIILAFFTFAFQFTNTRPKRPDLFWAILAGVPVLFNLLVVTDTFHHLIYLNPHLSAPAPFSELKYDYSGLVYLFVVYVYAVSTYGFVFLIKEALKKKYRQRWRIIMIAIGFFIPVVFSIFAALNISLGPQRDITPFTFALGNIVTIWGLFRFGVFEFAPIAREHIIESLADPIFVIDLDNRVIDVNSAGLNFLQRDISEVLGAKANQVFNPWSELGALVRDEKEHKQEISIKTPEDTIFLDIDISHVYNSQMNIVWRIVVLHDITRVKTLEVSYRILSNELDHRVRERTAELAESEERYRTLFDDSPIPLLEQDFSAVKPRIDQLLQLKIPDLQTYLLERPDLIVDLLECVRVTDANHAAMLWYAVDQKEKLQTTLGQIIDSRDYAHFVQDLLCLIHNKTSFENSVQRLDKNNNPLFLVISGKVSPGHEKTWKRIIVSILDITKLKQAEIDLATAYDTTLEGWARALELKDKETEGHSRRVIESTISVAKALGYSDQALTDIRRGAILHDIGKMAIPDNILKKAGPLTEKERKIIEQHPQVAYDLLKNIPHLKNALEIPYTHHEKWDGTGYPHKLAGTAIPLAARIFAIVDVWDALSHDRPYRPAWSPEKVRAYIQAESSKHFDPEIVAVFLELLNKGEI
ncbi:MAG: HD domain-containing protein [Anaerolineales bacterium]|nr:HD domain-containing protein [Anaerolineales bacterium]